MCGGGSDTPIYHGATTTLWLTGRDELYTGCIHKHQGNRRESPSSEGPGHTSTSCPGTSTGHRDFADTRILPQAWIFSLQNTVGNVAAPTKLTLSTPTGFVLTALLSNALLHLSRKSALKFYHFWRAFLYSAIKVALMWSMQPRVSKIPSSLRERANTEQISSAFLCQKVVSAYR